MPRRLLLVALVIAVGACSPSAADTVDTAAAAAPTAPATTMSRPSPSPTPSVAPPDPAEIAAAAGANELGQVPVLMYHRVLPDARSDYDRTPEDFAAELRWIFAHGYHPARTVDLARGRLATPAGTTPAVLTFDDATKEQIGFVDDPACPEHRRSVAVEGRCIDPATAVGILLDVAAEFPDVGPTASFYLHTGWFGGGEDGPDLVRELDARGFEVSNHSLGSRGGSTPLTAWSAAEVRREIAQGMEEIRSVLPDAEVATFSLPLGVWPEPRGLAIAGSWENAVYEHDGVLLVGANPAPSPYVENFDALAIPRIRSFAWDGGEPNYGSSFWLDVLERHPERRYVSDGDADTVAFPEDASEGLAAAYVDRAVPYPSAPPVPDPSPSGASEAAARS